jgi:hypothetical protein
MSKKIKKTKSDVPDSPKKSVKAKKPKRAVGRPPFTPSAEQRGMVTAWAMFGMSHERIAELIGVDVATLNKHFASELSTAQARLLAQSMSVIYNLMSSGKAQLALQAAKFVLSRKGKEYGWTKKLDYKFRRDLFAGLDLSLLDKKEMAELHRMLVKAGAPIELSDIPQTAVRPHPAPTRR